MAKSVKKGWMFDPKEPLFGKKTKRGKRKKKTKIFSF